MQQNMQKGNKFRSVFDSYSRTVYSVAFSYMKNSSDANDAMQEAFLKYYEHMDRLKNDEHIKPWLITVTSNICRNMLRSGWFTKTVSTDECGEISCEQDFGEGSELFNAVMALPEKERIPVHLFYYEGCSAAEIARLTKTKESTVRVRLMRGREKLKKMLKNQWESEGLDL